MQSDDIFTNQKEVVENLKESAVNLGIDPSRVAPTEEKPKQQLMAKKNCKQCYGQGVLTIAGFDVAVKTKEKNFSIDSSKKSLGRFKKTEGRNSSKKESAETKKALMYCRCVRPAKIEQEVQTT